MYLKYKTNMEEVKTPMLQKYIEYCREQPKSGPTHHAAFFTVNSPSQRDGTYEKGGLCHQLNS